MVATDNPPSAHGPVLATKGQELTANGPELAANAREKQGRKWLVVSFIFCPCHLPVIMAVLGMLFGGTTLGALIGRNTIGVGIIFGVIYTVLLVVGFRHVRAATRDIDCSDGECALPNAASPGVKTTV